MEHAKNRASLFLERRVYSAIAWQQKLLDCYLPIRCRGNMFIELFPSYERLFWLNYSGFRASCHIMYRRIALTFTVFPTQLNNSMNTHHFLLPQCIIMSLLLCFLRIMNVRSPIEIKTYGIQNSVFFAFRTKIYCCIVMHSWNRELFSHTFIYTIHRIEHFVHMHVINFNLVFFFIYTNFLRWVIFKVIDKVLFALHVKLRLHMDDTN
jgi:hypothetical protein